MSFLEDETQGASRAAPGKSGHHARGEGERVMALESREGTRASPNPNPNPNSINFRDGTEE